MNYIKSILLLNFQSWSKNSPGLSLKPDIINIIEGPNETGKSVFYKVIYTMIFPRYWAASELIRTGYKTGIMLLSLADGTRISYALERSSYSITLYPTSGKEKCWVAYNSCPQEIIDTLGLIVDTNCKVILNIIDKDVPLPFVKTTPRFNASLIRSIVEPANITELLTDIKVHMADVDRACKVFAEEAGRYLAAFNALEYRSIDALREREDKNNRILAFAQSLVVVMKQLTLVDTQISQAPLPVKNPDSAEQFVILWSIIKVMISYCSECITAISNIPKKQINPDVVSNQMSLYDKLNVATISLVSVNKRLKQVPRKCTNPQQASMLIMVYDKFVDMYSAFVQYQNLLHNSPIQVKDMDLAVHIQVYDSLADITKLLKTIITTASLSGENKRKELACRDQIKAMQNKYGVCPTCGRLLEEHT